MISSGRGRSTAENVQTSKEGPRGTACSRERACGLQARTSFYLEHTALWHTADLSAAVRVCAIGSARPHPKGFGTRIGVGSRGGGSMPLPATVERFTQVDTTVDPKFFVRFVNAANEMARCGRARGSRRCSSRGSVSGFWTSAADRRRRAGARAPVRARRPGRRGGQQRGDAQRSENPTSPSCNRTNPSDHGQPIPSALRPNEPERPRQTRATCRQTNSSDQGNRPPPNEPERSGIT